VDGVVAHALEVGHHAQRRHEHAQVAGDRLLAGHEVERPLLRAPVEGVDRLVGADDHLGQLEVGVEQGGGCPAHGGAGQVGHLHQGAGDAVELVVVGVAHGRSLGAGGSPERGAGEPASYAV
jgi:hypothetical protein